MLQNTKKITLSILCRQFGQGICLLQHDVYKVRSTKVLFDEFGLENLGWPAQIPVLNPTELECLIQTLGLYVQHQYMTSPISKFSWLNEHKIPQMHSKIMWKEEISTFASIVLGWDV